MFSFATHQLSDHVQTPAGGLVDLAGQGSQVSGGRHESMVGFNNSYTPEDVTTERVEDVNLRYRSFATRRDQPAGPGRGHDVQLAVLREAGRDGTRRSSSQDRYSIGRLTAIAGIRWERVEGLIPEQMHPLEPTISRAALVIEGLNVT